LTNKNRNHIYNVADKTMLPSLKEFAQIAITFCMTTFAWIFFRAESLTVAFDYIKHLFSFSVIGFSKFNFTEMNCLLLFFFSTEWLSRRDEFGIEKIVKKLRKPIRWIFYLIIVFMIFIFGQDSNQFIYFQF